MFERRTSLIVGAAVLAAAGVSTARGGITVYNNFGPGHDGWDYNGGLGWTVAGENVPTQYGVEQAMSFTSTADGVLSDIWVGMWYVPSDPGYDEVTLRLVERHGDTPPQLEDVMEEWTITEIESGYQWNPPIHLVGDGSSELEADVSYWLWAIGGETTWCGWCVNIDPQLTCPHTLRREGEDWLPIGDETASAFRVDLASPCPADVNNDDVVDIDDLFAVLAAWGACEDCPEDINDDGVVDIDDVFEVLGQWGPC